MPSALVVTDLLTTYDFEDADGLAESVEQALPAVRTLLRRAQEGQIPVIYVNDNYGDWNSSAEELLRRGLEGRRPDLVEPVRPPHDASFVIKARHSIFYGTPLEYLLGQLGVDRIVLCGVVTEQCILYSALDAYVRQLHVAVPRDAVAHIDPELSRAALEMMHRNMDADLSAAADCAL